MVESDNTKSNTAAKNAKSKKDDKKKEEVELSEEDKQLKESLELVVQRVQDTDSGVQKMALEHLRKEIRSTTSSVTSIPKTIKFLRPHYDTLKNFFQTLPAENTNKSTPILQKLYADILSVLAMTMGKQGERETLTFKLQGSDDDLNDWSHEYLRFLSGQVGEEYQNRYTVNPDLEDSQVQDLVSLVSKLLPIMIKTQAEIEACDLLLEVEKLSFILEFVDKDNYKRIGTYLKSCAKYYLDPDNVEILQIAYQIYKKLDAYPDALLVALQMNDPALIQETLFSCTDPLVQKQLAFMLSRSAMVVKKSNLEEMEDEETTEQTQQLNQLMGNMKLSEYYRYLMKELDSLEPKAPEDIYKSHLTETRSTMSSNIDSARQNLASSIVSAFVNAGSGTDKLLTEESTRWIFRHKDHGMLSATASLGMLYLWNIDEGFGEIDKYVYSGDNNIKAGGYLAFGLVNACVRSEEDAAYAFLSEQVSGNVREIRIASILGLGIAYAGTAKEEILELLMPILADSDQPIDIVAFTALTLGLVFVGTCNEDIATAIITVFMDRNEATLQNSLVRYLSLALGLLFLSKQDSAEAILETCKTLNPKVAKYCEQTVETCAHAGTGNVLKIQQLLKVVGEQHEEEKKDQSKESSQQQQQQQSSAQAKPSTASAQQQQQAKKDEAKEKEYQYQSIATLGIALIALGEDLGSEMATRTFDHLLQYGNTSVKKAVPLALGLLNVSNAKLPVMDTLSKLSHDNDVEIAQSAIFALGLIGAGTNNARIAQLLRQLSSYYVKDANTLFVVRIAQGLLFAGKGLITMSPLYNDRSLISPVALASLLVLLHSSLDMKNILLGNYSYVFFILACAMYPRMMVTVDENLEPMKVSVRVGTAVDTVALAGKPKTITGFQTHDTPVILQHDDRAELGTEEYISLTPYLEGTVILKKNPEYVEQ